MLTLLDNKLQNVIENMGKELIRDIKIKQERENFYNYLRQTIELRMANGEFDSILQRKNYNTNKDLCCAVLEELEIMTSPTFSKLEKSSEQ